MYVEILILATLHNKSRHGYDIKKYTEYLLGGSILLNNTVLYPTLKRLEEMGAVQREVERQTGKPDRHIYHLTDPGLEYLQSSLSKLPPELIGNDAEFFTRVAFFDLVKPETRIEILTLRISFIEKKLERLQHLEMLREQMGLAEPRVYGDRVLQFQKQTTYQEAQWLRQLLEEAQHLLERSQQV